MQAKRAKRKWGSVCVGDFSLSLSLSLVGFLFAIYFFQFFKFFCSFYHFERSDPTGCKAQAAAKKSTKIKRKLTILGYFANAQYDKFGLLSKNNEYFYSNFKAQIQIFHSKFKAFCKFKALYKFNSFHKFISNFKPYTRLFHIFTPNFCSVQTDKFQHKEKKWQMKTPSLIILSI